VLSVLFRRAPERVFLRDLAQECGLSVTPVHRQLAKLEALGLIRSQIIGRARAYEVNQLFPGVGHLAELVQALTGVVPLLHEALEPLDIELAFIFGSVAAGTDAADSDIDLLIVGDVPGRDLATALATVEQVTGRQISPVHLRPDGLPLQEHEASAFWDSVRRGPKLLVKGTEHELRGLTASGDDPPPRPDTRGDKEADRRDAGPRRAAPPRRRSGRRLT
jgi:predicted nucleotidyltransferase